MNLRREPKSDSMAVLYIDRFEDMNFGRVCVGGKPLRQPAWMKRRLANMWRRYKRNPERFWKRFAQDS